MSRTRNNKMNKKTIYQFRKDIKKESKAKMRIVFQLIPKIHKYNQET